MSAYRGAVLTIVLGVLLITLSEFALAQQPDFSGRWLRNAEMSPFWRESYDSAPRKEARKWQQENVRRLTETIEAQLALAEQIEIRQTARDLSFNIAGRGLRIFYFDRDHVRQTAWAEKVEASMDWDGGDVLIVEVTESGSTVTERLTRLSDDQFAYLFVWEDSDLFEEPVSIRSVYDRAPN